MAIITELENSLQDTRPREVKFLNSVQNRLLDRNGNTNSSVVSGKGLNLFPNAEGFIFTLGATTLQNINNFFVGSEFSTVNSLPNPNFSQKLNNIKDINLKLDIYAKFIDAGGYSPPAITDFSINFHANLFLVDPITTNIFTDTRNTPTELKDERLVTVPFEFNFFASDPLLFTITQVNKEFRLSDTIIVRPEISGEPDFTTNPTKITRQQYNDLTNSHRLLAVCFGVGDNDFTALSADQQQLLIDLFAINTFGGVFGLTLQADIFYFGQTASYIPFTN